METPGTFSEAFGNFLNLKYFKRGRAWERETDEERGRVRNRKRRGDEEIWELKNGDAWYFFIFSKALEFPEFTICNMRDDGKRREGER